MADESEPQNHGTSYAAVIWTVLESLGMTEGVDEALFKEYVSDGLPFSPDQSKTYELAAIALGKLDDAAKARQAALRQKAVSARQEGTATQFVSFAQSGENTETFAHLKSSMPERELKSIRNELEELRQQQSHQDILHNEQIQRLKEAVRHRDKIISDLAERQIHLSENIIKLKEKIENLEINRSIEEEVCEKILDENKYIVRTSETLNLFTFPKELTMNKLSLEQVKVGAIWSSPFLLIAILVFWQSSTYPHQIAFTTSLVLMGFLCVLQFAFAIYDDFKKLEGVGRFLWGLLTTISISLASFYLANSSEEILLFGVAVLFFVMTYVYSTQNIGKIFSEYKDS